jgi:hypothetical protein
MTVRLKSKIFHPLVPWFTVAKYRSHLGETIHMAATVNSDTFLNIQMSC